MRELRKDIVAKWLHVVALCHCGEHLTDGFVDDLALEQIINDAGVPLSAAKRAIPKLIEVGLWLEHETGFLIRDYLDYNPTSQSVKEKRSAARERMSNLRRSREQDANFARSSVTPSPTPTPERSSALRELDERLRGAA